MLSIIKRFICPFVPNLCLEDCPPVFSGTDLVTPMATRGSEQMISSSSYKRSSFGISDNGMKGEGQFNSLFRNEYSISFQ